MKDVMTIKVVNRVLSRVFNGNSKHDVGTMISKYMQ